MLKILLFGNKNKKDFYFAFRSLIRTFVGNLVKERVWKLTVLKECKLNTVSLLSKCKLFQNVMTLQAVSS